MPEKFERCIDHITSQGKSTDSAYAICNSSIKELDINESAIDDSESPQFKAFTGSSSFVGNVRYNSFDNSMRVLLNGKAYTFCDVPERVYDSFKGASSKGAYFNRILKKQFSCKISEATNNADDMDWPPKQLSLENYEHVFPNYSPEGDRPDGITPDELLLSTEPWPAGKPYVYPETNEQQAKCGNCKFFVEGNECALVRDVISEDAICKFHEFGDRLPFGTQVFPLYDKTEASYEEQPAEPYLAESHSLYASDTGAKKDSEPSMHNEEGHLSANPMVKGSDEKSFSDNSLIFDFPPFNETWNEEDHPRVDKGTSAGGQFVGKNKFGFNLQKNQNIKITDEAREIYDEDVLSAISEKWNSIPAEHRNLISKITISDKISPDGALGHYAIGTGELSIYGTDEPMEQERLPDVLTHEVGHAIVADLDSETIRALDNAISNNPPLNSFIEDLEAYGYDVPSNRTPETIAELYSIQSFLNDGGDLDEYPWVVNTDVLDALSNTLKENNIDFKFNKPITELKISRFNETKLIRETVAELAQQFNWITPDYLDRVRRLSPEVGGRFVLVRASAEAITDHRSEGEPYRRLLKGDELAQLTRTGIGKTTDINHLGTAYAVDSDVLDAEYDQIRKESQMLVHLRDPEIIQYIESGDINAVSINAGQPRHMHTECDTGECFVVPRGLVLGEIDGIAFTWVVTNPAGITWQGRYIPKATPGVGTTKLELI